MVAESIYSQWSKNDLIKEINKLRKRKKYGVVWDHEREPEKVVLLCKEKLPILKESVNKSVLTNNKSVNHILIEDDNFHTLSVLNYTHRNKVDVIYIDPPYNTGKKKEWKYNDRYVDKEDSYRHSKWLTLMSKRLSLARPLLKSGGMIFISIDDNEIAQLKLVCDEIFGEKNLVANFIWRTAGNFDNQAKVKICHEYILCYAKDITKFQAPKIIDPNIDTTSKLYKEEIRNTIVKNGPKNPISEVILPSGFPANFKEGVIKKRDDAWPQYSKSVKIKNNKTQSSVVVKSGWSSRNLLDLFISSNFQPVIDTKGQDTIFELTSNGTIEVVKKRTESQSHVLSVLTNLGSTQNTSQFLKKNGIEFTYPKPVELIKYLLSMSSNRNAVVLDFFAGSGTTAHAVLELNSDDGGNRQFIVCTNNENNICTNVCYPRIKQAICGFKHPVTEKHKGLGGNLRYFKTDFVDAEQTDKNKKKLVDHSTEMLCLKEGCYYEVLSSKDFRMFTDMNGRYLGIVYDDKGIAVAKKEIKKLNKKISLFVFSLDESAREEEFENILDLVDIKPIPEVILNVYRRIFK
ncbi:site-specific DNA-methyltransferase [Nanoarchaeota archaeon]